MSTTVPSMSKEKVTSIRRLFLVVGTTAVAVAVSISVLAYHLASTYPRAGQRPVYLRIISVESSPNHGIPNGNLTITAIVDSEYDFRYLSVVLSYETLFASNNYSGGGLMQVSGDDRYTMQIGPFEGGCEVWIVVAAYVLGETQVADGSLSVIVGDLERGGPSGLNISSVTRTPLQPSVRDTVTVNATVTSSSAIGEVYFLFSYAEWTHLGMASWAMTKMSPTQFTVDIDNPFLFGYVYEAGTVFLYRIAARDASNNTALSAIESFVWV